MLSGEATNTNFIVFGFTQSGLELTIYRTRGEHANHYVTVVLAYCNNTNKLMIDDMVRDKDQVSL